MEIKEAYENAKYSEEERKAFPYIDKYEKKVEEYCRHNDMTLEILKRYILVAFWIEYRAANYNGSHFDIRRISADSYLNEKQLFQEEIAALLGDENESDSTKAKVELDKAFFEMKRRRDAYFYFSDKDITSIQEYIDLLGLPLNENPEDYLYSFAVNGKQ